MGILTDYFAATPSELEALDVLRGPVRAARVAGSPQRVPATRPGFIGRIRGEKPKPARVEMPAVEVESDLDVVSSKGIDPEVSMATLEEILTGVDALEIIREGGVDRVATGANETAGPWVFGLRPKVLEALSNLQSDELSGVAARWAATDELAGSDPDVLAGLLADLQGLLTRAARTGRGVYCWVSL
jgi:hypothetical protein